MKNKVKQIHAKAKDKIYWHNQIFTKDDIIYNINEHPAFEQLKLQDKVKLLESDIFKPETVYNANTDELYNLLKNIHSDYILDIFYSWEKQNPNYKGGRKTALKLINNRVKEISNE